MTITREPAKTVTQDRLGHLVTTHATCDVCNSHVGTVAEYTRLGTLTCAATVLSPTGQGLTLGSFDDAEDAWLTVTRFHDAAFHS